MKINKGICVYRRISNILENDFFDSWNTIEEYNGAYLENFYTSEDIKKMWFFDINKFCADVGMVGVFLRDEVLRIYPGFEKDYKDSCYTLIKNFKGTIKFKLLDKTTIIVKGNGNINFETRQIGF